MYQSFERYNRIYACNQTRTSRYLNPSSILIEHGYRIDVFAEGLNVPSSILFTEEGELLIADSGFITGNPSVSRYVDGEFEVIADNFRVPISGINSRDGDIYVSHRGMITVLKEDGRRLDVMTGLPSCGDYINSRVAFGNDNKMYFGQGTATNSGVVGTDNYWVHTSPAFHDNPGCYIILKGQNFTAPNILIEGKEDALTGAFSAFGEHNFPFETRKGVVKASGSILRANLDGTNLESIVWGLRSPSYLDFDSSNRLFVSNNGFDIRGSRPIANAPDEFQLITENTWYGWPDYAGGEPVTLERFKPENSKQPEFLLSCHPNVPPKPYAVFPPEATILGFDFNKYKKFGNIGDVYIAEFGSIRPGSSDVLAPQYPSVGHKVSKIDILTGSVNTFAMNKSGFSSSLTQEGGFARPSDVAFCPEGNLYIIDTGINAIENSNIFIPHTGVIWKVTRSQ